MSPTAPLRLELRPDGGRASAVEIATDEAVIGSVAGCDLRLPGTQLPPVIGVIARRLDGVSWRKLAPALTVTVNGRPFASGDLADGDRLRVGTTEITVQYAAPAAAPAVKAAPGSTNHLFDRVSAMQRGVEIAGRKIQDQRRQLDADRRDLLDRQAQLDARERELERQIAQAANAKSGMAVERAEHESRLKQTDREIELRRAELDSYLHEQRRILADRVAECAEHERKLADERKKLDSQRKDYPAELARLDRLQETLELRERQANDRHAEVDKRYEQLQLDARDLEEQARQLDAAFEKQRTQSEELARRKAELDEQAGKFAERAAALESQQAMLTTLRAKLDRMRDEIQVEAEAVAGERDRMLQRERDIDEKLKAGEQRLAEIESTEQQHRQEREFFERRNAEFEAAEQKFQEREAKLAADAEALRHRESELGFQQTDIAGRSSDVQKQEAAVQQLREQLEAERAALKEREAALEGESEALRAMQEQLRRRGEELADRQQSLDKQSATVAGLEAEWQRRHGELEVEREQMQAAGSTLRQLLDARAAAVSEREDAVLNGIVRLRRVGRNLAVHKKAIAVARKQYEFDQKQAAARWQQQRAELEAFRAEAVAPAEELQRLVPELETRSQEVLRKLGHSREQLKRHLGELHDFARQCQADLEAVRADIRVEGDRVREREQELTKARADHRLAVASFRQQLIDWQAQVQDMKLSLATDETRLDRKQAEVAAAAEKIDAVSGELAKRSEELTEQETRARQERGTVEFHLADMRDWFRRKLRELAESTAPGLRAGADEPFDAPAGPVDGVVSLTADLDPGDRQLGELLRSVELVDDETLTALLLETRRQRRTLRQVLLASGKLTVYQMALIEAGNIDGLAIGPFGVIERLSANPRETVYRVLDPRPAAAGGPRVLRHLAEAEAQHATHPDEFCQRFAAAAEVVHPNVARTYEVLEIQGRPAVLQEWPVGLPGTDWPPAVAAPAVAAKLLFQVADGLWATHMAGLGHGHLTAKSLVLGPDGTAKILGVGEPAWLPTGHAAGEPLVVEDLAALGRVAAAWSAAGSGRKTTKPWPAPLAQIVERMKTGDYATAGEVLTDLESIILTLPANAAAWERVLSAVRETAGEAVAARMSA